MTSKGETIDVGAWLRDLDLRENAIDETVFASLTHENLKELGVAALGHRLKLLNAIADQRAGTSANSPSATVTSTSGAPSSRLETTPSAAKSP